jgi:hypothetical protein
MWEFPPVLRDRGFRVTGSHAVLDSVLDPVGKSRIRVQIGERWPFAWVPNARYNVVLTFQQDPKAQDYLPSEIAALKKFVKQGGGLVISGAAVKDAKLQTSYPLNKLAKAFDAELTATTVKVEGGWTASALKLGPDWIVESASENQPTVAVRTYGKGRVVIAGDPALASWRDNVPDTDPRSAISVQKRMAKVLTMASSGSKPIGGSLRVIMESAGGVGGAIYPEMEERLPGAVVYYAKNQFKSVLETVRKDVPKVDKQVRAWTPSPLPKDPMMLILAAGYGGGWAVNIFEPKEVGIIAPEPSEILSILAHEVAHTCYLGAPSPSGKTAYNLPDVFSEAHAGWFQRKTCTWLNKSYAGHQPNNLFTFDKDGTHLDLANVKDHGQGWTKLWWIFQKLDEKYGVTWYPRWMWVKNVRWADDPAKLLTWDEVVEDMSIACGEDLFPFFKKIGTTLSKDRFASAEFQGKTLNLSVAEIPLGPCGSAITDPIGDYTKPLKK